MNFDAVIDRGGTDSVKWSAGADILPLWVADMDFACPDEVVSAIRERAAHPIYGYTEAGGCLGAIVDKLRADYGWPIDPEWVVFTSGVVEALNIACLAYADPGDNVLMHEPAYGPFYRAIRAADCTPNTSALIEDGGEYRMDIQDMRAKADERTRALMLCSPHNPTGRVWSRQELEEVAQLCDRRDLVVLSDEIHCDILMPGARHTAFATLSERIARRTVTFLSPSKTFNLAGLNAAIAVIPDRELRARFCQKQVHRGLNLFGYTAIEAAYRHGGRYQAQMCAYVSENMDLFLDFIARRLPMLRARKPQGTYLLWVDMRALGMQDEQLARFFAETCRIRPNMGTDFGKLGSGFARFNLACPRSTVREALRRLEAGIHSLAAGEGGKA